MPNRFLQQTENMRAAAVCVVLIALFVASCGTQPSATSTPAAPGQQAAVPSSASPTVPPDTGGTTATAGVDPSATVVSAANFPPGVGDIAPDFTLPIASGGEITVSQFRGETPVVLVFYRAFW